MKKKILFKEFLLVLVTIIWGLGFIAQLIGGDYLDAYTFNFCRNIVATIILLVLALFLDLIKKKKNVVVETKWNNKKLWIGGSLAGVALIFAMTTQQMGIMLEGAGKSGFLTALYIIFVPIISLIFGKKINRYVAIAIVFSLTGLYLINFTTNEFHFSFGSILLLLCALGYSIQILVIDKFSKGVDAIKFSSIQFAVATIIGFVFTIIFGNIDFDLILKALPSILYLGIISSGVAYTVQVYAQKDVNVNIACIIMSLESVFSLFFGMVIINEKHGFIELLGCLFILIAVILAQLEPKKLKKGDSLND